MHRNDKRSTDEYHLYRIWDREAEEPFKFGISADEINPKDGLSKRIRSQVNLFNRVVGSLRFFGEVLLRGILGRARAEKLEDEYIDRFEQEKGYRPRGNPDKKR
jgi:hypothetical protein